MPLRTKVVLEINVSLLDLKTSCLSRLGSELGPSPIRSSLLVEDKVNTLLLDGGLSPALEFGSLVQQGKELGAEQTMLRLSKA